MTTGLFGKQSFVQDRQHLLVLVGLFVMSLVIYTSTMSRGITWLNTGPDGGDFISAARAWGVPHPTGYPTYTMLLRLFGDVVAIGDHAFRANLFSAVMGALAVPFVYVAALRVLRRLPGSEVGDSRSVTVAALIAALAFGTSRLFWSQATVTEVYTLNTLFASSLLVLTLGVVRDLDRGSSSIRNRTLLAVLLGVGLGNHTTLGLLGAPFGVWVMWLVWRRFGWRGVFDWRPLVGLLAGLSVYIYVPIAASAAPIVSWGSPDSFEGFRWMISGTIYRPYAFGLSNDLISGRIATIAELLFTQFTIVGTVIGIAGLTTIWSYSREFVIASVASVLVVTVYAVAYDTVDSFIYLILVFMIFSLWLAVGIAAMGQGIRRFTARTAQLSSYQRQLYVGVFAVVVLIVPVWSVATGWGELNLAGEDGPAQFAEETIAKAAGGVVFAEEPELFALVYQAQVADPELDVMVVGPLMLSHDWYWDQLVRYYGDRIPDTRPATYEDRLAWIVDHNHNVVPMYSTHDDRDHYDIFNMVADGDLYRFDY